MKVSKILVMSILLNVFLCVASEAMLRFYEQCERRRGNSLVETGRLGIIQCQNLQGKI